MPDEIALIPSANVLPIVGALRTNGVTDLRGQANALNSRGVRTARGGRCHVFSVRSLLEAGRCKPGLRT